MVFRLFQPKCPINTFEKTSVELALRRLVDGLGLPAISEANVVLPDEHFRDFQNGQAAPPQQVFQTVCELWGVNSGRFDLKILDGQPTDGQPPEAEGAAIVIGDTQQLEPMVAAITCQLSRRKMMDQGLDRGDSHDQWLMYLMPSFMGFGIFVANSTATMSPWTGEGKGASGTAQPMGLPSRVHAYALALFAWIRSEHKPDWAGYLRPDAAVPMHAALRYLVRTGDANPHSRQALDSLLDDLQTGRASTRLAALWHLGACKDSSYEAAVGQIAGCLADRDPWIRSAAAAALPNYGAASAPYLPQLCHAMKDAHPEVRAAAVQAVALLAEPHEEIALAAGELLRDENQKVIYTASFLLRHFGHKAAIALEDILCAVKSAVIDCNFPLAEDLIETLRCVAESPRDALSEYFGHDDELLLHVMEVFEEAGGGAGSANTP